MERDWLGLVNAIDDRELTAYIHYLCVNPKYQGQGIGKNLLQRIKDKYRDYLYIILIAENEDLVKYYCQNGFEYVDGRKMFTMAKNIAREKGYSFLQVKTVQMGKYEDYPFGDVPICYKLNGKVFAQIYLSPEDYKITLKCTADAGQFYRMVYPGKVVRGYH